MDSASAHSERRTIHVFPGDGNWYRIELPYPDEVAEALYDGETEAWHSLLQALAELVETAAHTAAE